MMTQRVPLLLLVAASALLLAGCTPPAPVDTAAPTPTPSPTASATPTEAPPVTTPTAGDCTPADSENGRPTYYTVFSDDSTTPITLSYTAFNRADAPVLTETVYGPMFTLVGYPCSDASNQHPWTFTATSSSGGSIACVLAFGGKLVKTDSQYNEGATTPMTADCTGHPGM